MVPRIDDDETRLDPSFVKRLKASTASRQVPGRSKGRAPGLGAATRWTHPPTGWLDGWMAGWLDGWEKSASGQMPRLAVQSLQPFRGPAPSVQPPPMYGPIAEVLARYISWYGTEYLYTYTPSSPVLPVRPTASVFHHRSACCVMPDARCQMPDAREPGTNGVRGGASHSDHARSPSVTASGETILRNSVHRHHGSFVPAALVHQKKKPSGSLPIQPSHRDMPT